jgi:uncharacterized protein
MNTAPASAASPGTEPATPWWRVGMVWLVVGGPATVVVAALVTAGIAIAGADTLVTEPAPVAAKSPSGSHAVAADTPAIQGRNHAVAPQR